MNDNLLKQPIEVKATIAYIDVNCLEIWLLTIVDDIVESIGILPLK